MSSTARQKNRYSEAEISNLIDFVMALKKKALKPLMMELGLKVSGTKPEFREQISSGIKTGSIEVKKLISFLNEQAPLSKQHVYLFDGVANRSRFRKTDYLKGRLVNHKLEGLYNSSRSLLLPEVLTLSTIRHSTDKLTVYANMGKSYLERDSELDEQGELEDGSDVEWRAYRRHIERISVIFRWDLINNNASLHITQLPSRMVYENVRDAFFDLVRPWLPAIDNFAIIDTQKAIKNLHKLHAGKQGETDSHKIGYRTPGGIDVTANSSSVNTSLHDSKLVEDSMGDIRDGDNVTGRVANIWFLTQHDTPHLKSNPLQQKTRVEIIGYHKRINFPSPQPQEVINYVLGRIRRHCR